MSSATTRGQATEGPREAEHELAESSESRFGRRRIEISEVRCVPSEVGFRKTMLRHERYMLAIMTNSP